MSNILSIVRDLYPFTYSVAGAGNDDSIAIWQKYLPFTVHEFPAGAELNGWIVSPPWSVKKAEIRKDGTLIYDGTKSPLGVITQSPSFSGVVDRDELVRHLFWSEDDPNAIVYHWAALYRPSESEWGFCVPHTLVERLEPGKYDVDIVTETSDGTMKVLDYCLPGSSNQTILFNGHNCHPFQANDDISGCAVGIAVMKRLAALPERRFSYRLIVAPELIGTVFWLDALGEKAEDLVATIMLKSVGNDSNLRLQQSFTGIEAVDRAAHHVFRHRYGNYESGAFRTIYGNDETVFEAPGFEIPSISLTRWPFPEYHTDRDTPDRVSEERLQDTAETAFSICRSMERNLRLERLFKGLVCLSHPRYDLYRAAPAPGLDKAAYTAEKAGWNLLMNNLPRHLDGQTDLLEIAERYGVSIDALYDYVMEWVAKGLARVAD